MNGWINAAQYATEALAIILIFRLLRLRDRQERVYSIFIAFLAIQLSQAVIYFAYSRWGRLQIDYRLIWITSTVVTAAFSLWLVYALARSVLAELPGIFRFSRILLNVAFPLAMLIAFSTARSEYGVSHGESLDNRVDRLLVYLSIGDRAIAMASVITLIAILGFILWFPVKMSKNLAVFSVGFVVYFASRTGIELLRIYGVNGSKATVILSTCGSVVLVLCFLYWIVFIDPKGQTAQVRIGHGWRLAEQKKLIDQLEALNVVLMRSSQRLEL
jgi:hypothetical protein